MIIKGNILYMENRNDLRVADNSYLIICNGQIEDVTSILPQKYQTEEVTDYGDKLIIPGMTDLHVHAPQYAFRGLGMDKELLQWLEQNAFPEEAGYADSDYAKEAYQIFSEDLLASPTTRACIFATIHKNATMELVHMLEEKGLITYVGKVNMDRNSNGALCEDTEQSLADTRWFIEHVLKECKLTKPIITPRFVPSCTDDMMRGLDALRREYHLTVQSHLSENLSEIAWVADLNKASKHYGDAYDMFGLFGGEYPAVMAHCVYLSDEEMTLMKKNGVFVAHCPNSNTNITSGIAPIRKYLDYGINIGLGTDIAAGFSLSMFHAIQDAVAVSKLYWRLVDQNRKPLTTWEAFYLATMGGGSFFGKVGSFLKGYEADILVLDDEKYRTPHKLGTKERLERVCYLADSDIVYAKYIRGKLVYRKS